jgi:AcrR family transcriptional regulator
MRDKSAENRQELRRRTIVAAARKAFLRNGYGQTTMSAIAAAVGGSKTTLWAYYRNKHDLFAAVVDDLVERYGEALRVPLPPAGDPAETLRALGRTVMGTILRPQIVVLHRLVTGEAGRFPELGQLLFERGINRGQARTAEWLAGQMQRGSLRPGDPMVAAQHFVGLLQSGVFQRHVLGAAPAPGADEIHAEVDTVVDVFMRAYNV